jgi:REP element-mobilizing transposase RayT
MVEVTTRTVQGRWLLRPSPELNEIVLGIIGRAQQRYDIELHAFTFLSNHFHLLATVRDAAQLAAFVGYVNGNLARQIGQLHDWQDRFWSRRYRAIVVADEGAQVARLKYCLSQGCKEGLVDRANEWPGVHCVDALVCGRALGGSCLERSSSARRRSNDDSRVHYPVRLSPIPCWRALDVTARQGRCADLVREVEAEAKALNVKLGRRALGARWILTRNPHDRPIEEHLSPAPMVHATTNWVRQLFISAYKAFEAAYRSAAADVRRGVGEPVFPSHSFPPPIGFRHPTTGQRDPFWDSFSLSAA